MLETRYRDFFLGCFSKDFESSMWGCYSLVKLKPRVNVLKASSEICKTSDAKKLVVFLLHVVSTNVIAIKITEIFFFGFVHQSLDSVGIVYMFQKCRFGHFQNNFSIRIMTWIYPKPLCHTRPWVILYIKHEKVTIVIKSTFVAIIPFAKVSYLIPLFGWLLIV